MRVLTAVAVAIALSTPAHAEPGLAGSHDLRKEAGKLCMSDHAHTGFGTGQSKDAARKAAIRTWIDFTDFEYGRAWASFANAAGAVTRYTKEEKGWSATIDARPCRR